MWPVTVEGGIACEGNSQLFKIALRTVSNSPQCRVRRARVCVFHRQSAGDKKGVVFLLGRGRVTVTHASYPTKRAFLLGARSNKSHRSCSRHGDGVVSGEAVMGWQVRDNRSSLQACTPKARVTTYRPTAKRGKSKFYLWGGGSL